MRFRQRAHMGTFLRREEIEGTKSFAIGSVSTASCSCAVLTGVLCLSGNAWAMTGFSGQKSAYNESSQGEVTVTVTISNDGIPIAGD